MLTSARLNLFLVLPPPAEGERICMSIDRHPYLLPILRDIRDGKTPARVFSLLDLAIEYLEKCCGEDAHEAARKNTQP